MWEIPLFNEKKIVIPYPKGPDPDVNYILGGLKHIPHYSVTVIPNGRFWGGLGGAVIGKDNRVFKELSHEVPQASCCPPIFKTTSLPKMENKNIAILHCFFGFNYYHWMFDVAARLDLIRKSHIPIDMYVTSCAFPFQDEILTHLGVPLEKRITITPYLYIQANQLVVPSFIHSYTGTIPEWAVHFLREELLVKRNVKKRVGYERIYISRAHASHRKITNEEEVVNLLQKHGFKRVFLEDESVAGKIELFHSANVILSSHGAGLTNLLFCNSGTKIVELFSPGWIFPCYRMISFYLGLDYYCLTGEGTYSYRVDLRKASDDITVNIGGLSKLLESL